MGPAPWWVTLLVGALTVGSSFLAARIGSNRALEATDQREKAAAREEWFRRVQWATELTLRTDLASQATGCRSWPHWRTRNWLAMMTWAS